MNTNIESVGMKSEKSPIGKVMGIVENRGQLDAVSAALLKLASREIEVLDGAAGIKFLDGEQDAVSQCFLGDMEAKMVQRYIAAVNKGQIVFAVIVEPEHADQAAEIAKIHGALEVVYFGNWVITNY